MTRIRVSTISSSKFPASTAGNQNVPVPGFDPITQTWKISLASSLPVITHPVIVDGFTQANIAVPYRYPRQVSSAVQDLLIGGSPTGGTFTLTTLAAPAAWNDSADSLLNATQTSFTIRLGTDSRAWVTIFPSPSPHLESWK